jgi:hypothetical protein
MPVQPSIHTIKVSLRHMKPPVWRRLQVPSKTSLAELHHIIPAAMAWYDCHLPWPGGFDEMMGVLSDDRHPEHEMYREWIPAGYDPVRCDLDKINEALAQLNVGALS